MSNIFLLPLWIHSLSSPLYPMPWEADPHGLPQWAPCHLALVAFNQWKTMTGGQRMGGRKQEYRLPLPHIVESPWVGDNSLLKVTALVKQPSRTATSPGSMHLSSPCPFRPRSRNVFPLCYCHLWDNLEIHTLLLSLVPTASLSSVPLLNSSQITRVEWSYVPWLRSGRAGIWTPVPSIYLKMPLFALLWGSVWLQGRWSLTMVVTIVMLCSLAAQ